jgi:hypothetical protein
MARSEPITLRTMAGERSARSLYSNARSSVIVGWDSLVSPIKGVMSSSRCCRH